MEYTSLDKNIEKAFFQMRNYIRIGEDGKSYIFDPHDSSRVIGHYGETHYCAAMLFYSERCGNTLYFETAIDLLEGILEHWKSDEQAIDYHADFNNFALALIYERLLCTQNVELADKVANKLIETYDSKNHTVNWLPMRAYANLLRYKLTNNDSFLRIAIELLNTVRSAQYQDGLFDDLLPKGQSFNLQYCISTAATIQLIYDRFKEYSEKLPKIDIKKTMSTLYALVLPDGDINYMGRGCNQIFAWGPWKYLISTYKNDIIAGVSLGFFEKNFSKACKNENILLNGYDGKDRLLWWDYHHYTVYMAHYLLWNELSYLERLKYDVNQMTTPTTSGLKVYRNESSCVITFSGRKHYLIEKGPVVVAIWTKKQGIIYKCGHGPSNGMFANYYFNPLASYCNHFGLISFEQNPKRYKNKFVRKIYQKFHSQNNSLQVTPLFSNVDITRIESKIVFTIESNDTMEKCFMFPTYCDSIDNILLFGDGVKLEFVKNAVTPSQYGDLNIYMSPVRKIRKWELILSLQDRKENNE